MVRAKSDKPQGPKNSGPPNRVAVHTPLGRNSITEPRKNQESEELDENGVPKPSSYRDAREQLSVAKMGASVAMDNNKRKF